jgi:glycyl-tRNA synthetase beta chain
MVGEFPELQGTMGRYYALHDDEPKEVANAIAQHYRPRFSGDAVPQTKIACAVALADKLDTVVAMIGIGERPTGDKDPFALRRQGLGVVRILIETPNSLDLFALIEDAYKKFPKGRLQATTVPEVRQFIVERMKNLLREGGEETSLIEAVVGQTGGRIYQLPKRLDATKKFMQLPEARDLAVANKRVLNIIRKNEEIGYKFSVPDRSLMSEEAEIALSNAVEHLSPIAEKHFDAGEYESNLRLLAKIKPDVDRFFDKVMVMVDDPKIRNNRAALLQQLGILMNQVADISKLAVEK